MEILPSEEKQQMVKKWFWHRNCFTIDSKKIHARDIKKKNVFLKWFEMNKWDIWSEYDILRSNHDTEGLTTYTCVWIPNAWFKAFLNDWFARDKVKCELNDKFIGICIAASIFHYFNRHTFMETWKHWNKPKQYQKWW